MRGVVELADGALGCEVVVAEGAVDADGEGFVFGGVGGVVVVEVHMEGGEVADVVGAHFADEFLGGDAFGFGAEHDGGAVRVVGADMPAFGSAHAMVSRPDVGLDVAEEVSEVDVPVGVRQRGGHQDATGRGGRVRGWREGLSWRGIIQNRGNYT